jgi:hypothetical protein
MPNDPCVKKSISMPESYYRLANIRIEQERLKGLTEYVQMLIRNDTTHLVAVVKPIAATKEKPASAKKAPKFKVAGANTINPSEISDGGPSTLQKGKSRRTG